MKVRFLRLSRVRISALFLFIAFFLYQNSIFADANRLDNTHLAQEITLIEAIHHISEQYQVLFNYDRNIVSDIKVQYEPEKFGNVDAAIASILKNTNLKYQIFSHRYVVIYKNDEEGIESLKEMIQHFQAIVDNREDIVLERQRLRPSPKLIRTLPQDVLGDRTIAFSIEGKVTDQDGEPLIGVNIQVKGTNMGTSTDIDGQFTLDDIDENALLVVSYIGYQTQEVPVSGKSNLSIVLLSDSQLLDEVVVVGYGTQQKTSITASVSAIKGEEIAALPSTSFSNNIGGRMSGVIVKQNAGEPGRDESNIFIRGISSTGSNQPLLVVDGIPRSFQNIDPNIIESISILKDAAAIAPFGVAGANGVILITTKSGNANRPTLTINSYLGVQNPTVLPDYLNGEEYAKLQNVIADNTGVPRPYSDEAIQKFKDGSDPDRYPPYYNIWDDVMSKNSLLQYYNIEFTGGSDITKYYASIGYQHQGGMWKWKTTSDERFNFALNVQSNVTNTTKLSLSLNGRTSLAERPPSDRLGAETTSVSQGTRRIFEQISYAHPGRGPIEFTNGLYGRAVIPILNGEGGYYRSEDKSLFTQFSIEQELLFLPGLELKGTIAYDPSFNNERTWATPFRNATVNTSQVPYVFTNNIYNQSKPSLWENWEQNSQLTFQGGLNFNKKIGFHNIGMSGIFEARSTKLKTLGASRINYDLFIDEISLGSSSNDDMSTSGVSSDARQVGIVYRANYNYRDKYLLEAVGRYDGHYYFAPGNRFGFFPAVAIGWRISEEPYLKDNVQWLANLKIRASYGEVGALAGAPFQYLSTYSVSAEPGHVINGAGVQRVIERSEPNPNITWERANKADLGIEIGLFKGLLSIEADYFYEKRANMLVSPNVITPREYGIGISQVNEGIMENRGFEFLSIFNYRLSSNMHFAINGTVTYTKNRVLQIFESSATFDNPNRSRTGKSLGTQFGYKAIGLFQVEDFDESGNLMPGIASQPWGQLQPGDIRYEDVNGDGIIDVNDHIPIGEPNQAPRIIYGFSPQVKYKNLTLDIFFQGAAKTNLYHEGEMIWAFYNGQNSQVDNLNYWTSQNRNAVHPRITSSPTVNNTQVSSFWMRDASYLRLKNFTLGYQLPTKIVENIGIQMIQLYVSGQNNLTWTKMIYLDPESQRRGYPQQKVVSFGCNITF